MTRNVGGLGRVIRIVIGLALLAGFIFNPAARHRWRYLVGIIPLVTGIVGSCGLYKVMGVNTCKLKH